MVACIAWGSSSTFPTGPGDQCVWGCEFELLPGGTMARASGILHGVVGQRARRLSATKLEVLDGTVVMLGIRGTSTDQLLPHQQELMDSYQNVPQARQTLDS